VGRAGGYYGRTAVSRNQSPQAGTAGQASSIDVARVVKKLAVRAGLDAAKYAGHSLRAGHATAAAIAGASERSIMNQTGHRSVQMVRRYIRDGSRLDCWRFHRVPKPVEDGGSDGLVANTLEWCRMDGLISVVLAYSTKIGETFLCLAESS
jgi:hypothetical protein